jgi:hypothetical protein
LKKTLSAFNKRKILSTTAAAFSVTKSSGKLFLVISKIFFDFYVLPDVIKYER